jgi:hypothetical protein
MVKFLTALIELGIVGIAAPALEAGAGAGVGAGQTPAGSSLPALDRPVPEITT